MTIVDVARKSRPRTKAEPPSRGRFPCSFGIAPAVGKSHDESSERWNVAWFLVRAGARGWRRVGQSSDAWLRVGRFVVVAVVAGRIGSFVRWKTPEFWCFVAVLAVRLPSCCPKLPSRSTFELSWTAGLLVAVGPTLGSTRTGTSFPWIQRPVACVEAWEDRCSLIRPLAWWWEPCIGESQPCLQRRRGVPW